MKKILSLVLAFMMMMTIVPALAENAAESENLLTSTTGLGDSNGSADSGESSGDASGLLGSLGSLLGGEGGLDVSGLLQTVMQKLGGKVNGANLNAIIDALKNKLGGLLGGLTKGTAADDSETGESSGETDLSALTGLLEGLGDSSGSSTTETATGTTEGAAEAESSDDILALLGSLFGTEGEGEEGSTSLDQLVESYKNSDEYLDSIARWQAMQEYMNQAHPELGKDDEQILTLCGVYKLGDLDPNVEFGCYTLFNYTKTNDGKDLSLSGLAGNVSLVNYEKQADGSYKVIVSSAESGEKFVESATALCEAYGVTYEAFLEEMDWQDFMDASYLYDFMRNHPEYEHIQFKDEMRTASDLDAMMDAIIEKINPAE